MTDIVQAAEAVVAQVEQTQAAADARVADVVEASQERIAEAEAAAQRISDAALQTELGRRVDGVATEIGLCRTGLQQMAGQLTAVQSQITELLTRPAAPISTPEPLTPAAPLVVPINPENVAPAAPEPAPPAPGARPAQHRRRVL